MDEGGPAFTSCFAYALRRFFIDEGAHPTPSPRSSWVDACIISLRPHSSAGDLVRLTEGDGVAGAGGVPGQPSWLELALWPPSQL
jgi:hypothetical protein